MNEREIIKRYAALWEMCAEDAAKEGDYERASKFAIKQIAAEQILRKINEQLED